MTKISVVTLGKGRPDHLANVVRGLVRQTMLPAELIVAVMQDDLYDLPEAPFPIRQMHVVSDALPLASARNAAARAASGEVIVFLDMDCIPTPSLLADYAEFLTDFDGLLMGEVLYLPGGATVGDWQYDRFAEIAVKHSDRRGPRRMVSRSVRTIAVSGRSTSRCAGRRSLVWAASTSAMSAMAVRIPISARHSTKPAYRLRG